MEITHNAITIAKTLLGIAGTAQDDILLVYGNTAEIDALKMTHNQDVLFDDYLLARMIQAQFNRRNEEGIASQSVATVSESYTTGTGYPDAVRNALRGYTKLKAL